MRWLCNENIPRPLVDALRESGHAIAIGARRICLTFEGFR
jgi:hypothetical protein